MTLVPPPPVYVLDIECYVNFFLVLVRPVAGGASTKWVMTSTVNEGWEALMRIVQNNLIVTFNGNNYDVPLLSLALNGATNETLKSASDAIILSNLKLWDLEREFGFERITFDHIDLIEVAPGVAGLKIYGGRLHSKRMQDLPIAPEAVTTPDEQAQLTTYCENDLDTTIDLYTKLIPQIDLRVKMSAQYGIDLRSKSDAQIAEAVIKSEVEKLKGARVFRPDIHRHYTFKYKAPSYLGYATTGMRKLLEVISATEFYLDDKGAVVMPRVLDSMHIRIGRGVYRMGIGGLHSSETSVAHRATAERRIIDRDVTSYYPSIILTQGLFPAHLGTEFLTVYRSLVDRRIAAKVAGDTVTADALKICVNGSFGKLGSKWSVLYSPDLLIAVTLTGQLALLMLIEALEESGIEVVSANTDGVVSIVLAEQQELFDAIVAMWEMTTGLTTEGTDYSALYSRDVNNYIAVKPDGSAKTKGAYAFEGLQKNATNTICVKAAIAYLTKGTRVEDTVWQCFDVRDFLTVRQVNGGAVWGDLDVPLGKAIRWYYSKGETGYIRYATNGNKVPRSEGAVPLMELPHSCPPSLDRQWYIDETNSILQSIGAA